MRNLLMVALVLLALTIPIVVAQEDAEELETWSCPEGFEGQTLNVYNWTTYIAEDTKDNFEDLCDVSVTYDTYESNEAVLATLRQGNPGFDIIVPTGDTVSIMIREELLLPLDHDAIPNMANLNPTLMDPFYDPGNVYSVPYQWGTLGFGYNNETITDELTSWEDVWAHDGPVAWIDDRRSMFGIALIMLGYDPNTEDPDEINEAKDYLIEHGGNVVVVAGDDGQEWLARGDVDVAIEYSGDIFYIGDECECDTYTYVIPEEGTNLWTDNMAVPVGAQNPELAMVWIDYILDPQVGADISNYTVYASPNQAAIDLGLIEAEYLEDPAIYPDEDTEANLFVIQDTSAEGEQLYNDAWDELLVLIGG